MTASVATLTPACLSSFVAELTPDGVFSADELLRQRPELWRRPSFVVELACEEYTRRIDAGESVEAAAFARRFAPVESSLLRRIEVDDWLDGMLSGEKTPQKPPAFEPGEHAFGFELLEEIGEGAFARVFLARETQLSRLVVVKFGVRGAEEASTMAMLEHPNIVQVHSAHPDVLPGVTAICMPYRGRRTLDDWIPAKGDQIPASVPFREADSSADTGPNTSSNPLRPAQLPFAEAVTLVAEDVLAALVHMHAAGVHHGDIKPSNVLVGDDGVARLLDFNLARGQDGLDGRLGGTMPYMAPELLQCLYVTRDLDRLGPADPRSDLFSLGATLYHVLTGVCPFGTRDRREPADAAAGRLIDAARPRPVRTLNPHIDPILAGAIDDCLARLPADRPASAQELARRLARRNALWQRLARGTRRHPRIRNAAAAGVLAAACVAGWQIATAAPYGERQLKAGWQAFEERRYEDAARYFSRAESTQGLSADALFGRALAHLAADDPERALPHFERLHAAYPSPEVAEGLAYCLAAGQRKFAAAIPLYESVVASRKPDAGLLNNIGYCLLRNGQREPALKYLTDAVAADPTLQVPHLNLALAELRRAQSDKTGQPLDVHHIETALGVGVPNPAICLTAAMTYAAAAQTGNANSDAGAERLRKRSLTLAEEALRLGLPPEFLRDLAWHLHGTDEAAMATTLALRSSGAVTPASVVTFHFVNPIGALVRGRTTGPVAAR